MLSYLRSLYHGAQAPRILITASTSAETLSKSGIGPEFSITLSATVEAGSPITVDPFLSLLQPDYLALYDRGLTFTNVETGQIAKRGNMNICYGGLDSLLTSDQTLEIPPESSGLTFEISHAFKAPVPGEWIQSQHFEGDSLVNSGPPRRFRHTADSDGLEVSQVYEIGLGEDLTKIKWWYWGSKWEVFWFGFYRRSRYPSEGTPELRMVLTNRATFTIVE